MALLAGERPVQRRRGVVGDRALPREHAAVDLEEIERIDADRIGVEPPASVSVDEQQPREVRAQDEMFRERRPPEGRDGTCNSLVDHFVEKRV